MRQARATVHHSCTRLRKDMAWERPQCSRTSSISRWRLHFLGLCATVNQEDTDPLCLKDSVQIKVPRRAIVAEAQKQHTNIIETARQEKFFEQKEKQQHEQHKVVVGRKTLEARPRELLQGLLRGVVKEVVHEGSEDADFDLDVSATPPHQQKMAEQAVEEVCASFKGQGGGRSAKTQASKQGGKGTPKDGPSTCVRGQSLR